MTMLLAGRPAAQIAASLEETLPRARPPAENWDTRAALLWVLVVAERFGAVEESLKPMLAQVHRSGSARGFTDPSHGRGGLGAAAEQVRGDLLPAESSAPPTAMADRDGEKPPECGNGREEAGT
jgi:hypothetical protein